MQPGCLLPSTCKGQLLLTRRLASCRFRSCSPSSNQVVQQRSSAQGQPCVSSSLSGWTPKRANPGRLPKMLCGKVSKRIPKPEMFKHLLFGRLLLEPVACNTSLVTDRAHLSEAVIVSFVRENTPLTLRFVRSACWLPCPNTPISTLGFRVMCNTVSMPSGLGRRIFVITPN